MEYVELYHWTNRAALEKIMREGLRRGSYASLAPACAYAKYFSDWSKGFPEELVVLKIRVPAKCVEEDPFGECVDEETGEILDKRVTCRVRPEDIKVLSERVKKLMMEESRYIGDPP